MADSPVLYHRRDSIVTLTLNRPETLTAMNEAMMAELERLRMGFEADTTALYDLWRQRGAEACEDG
jgi:enoyl-CoA hydratase/carnithine racemase